MHRYDVWIDLERTVSGSQETICTLFANRDFNVRPLTGESITFWSEPEWEVSFNIVSVLGVQSLHYLPTQIEDLAHHFHSAPSSTTHLRCVPIHVASIEDARRVVDFMCRHHGFEVDPYGVNKLPECRTTLGDAGAV